MTLVGYQVRGVNAPGVGIGLDPVESLVPVLVRGAPGNAAYIRSHGATHEQQPDAVDVTDPVTAIWLNRRIGNAENLRPALCYSDANTWAKANRGSMVANCLSVALNLHEGRLDAVPGGSGWTLSAIARMAMSRDVALWMDASKLPADQACAAILDWKDQPIDESSTDGERKARQWMLELKLSRGRFPASCKQLQDSGVTLLLRVPADLNDPAQAADWVASAVERGWPVSYSVALGQDLAVLPALLGQPGAQWTLNGVPAKSLPWKTVDKGVTAGLPAPMMLGVETDWDVNSRAVLAR